MKRVSKAEWLQAALHLLENEGVEAIRVDRLARELGISRSGFYWHFKNRDDLRGQIIEYWVHEFNEVVTENLTLREGDPRKRLELTMQMIVDHGLTRYELPIRAWAEADPAVARRVNMAYKKRMGFLRDIFRALGFEGDDLEMRTRLFLCYGTWEHTMFPKESKSSLRKLIKLRTDFLSKP
ncbi:TetR/AcrR family transcriptional regulator [Haloferula sp.]|uniref:TetR/AcrR family transcriptional regulator n=1 Tax=Haloferula sp. TaxID=2497595 RepID=UPI0032A10ECD